MTNSIQKNDGIKPEGRQASLSEPSIVLLEIVIGIFALVLALFAYRCVVARTFLGDDHVHLIWLRQAVLDPSLVLRNFYSNWLYAGTTPQCYRPIISLFMFTDYLLWHHNAVGFHITNLLFHLLGCAGLYGCVSEILRWSTSDKKERGMNLWPILAAATFALYPNHPEAVSWVTGRVDTIVTAFYLLSVYSYMVWRNTSRKTFFVSAIICMLLSLASKEMAVTIPIVFFVFEILKPAGSSSFGSRVKSAFLFSAPAWGILLSYFLLRRFALGTFIGGYDDTLAINIDVITKQWSGGLYKLFVPINAYYGNEYFPLVAAWICLTIFIYLSAVVYGTTSKHRNQLLFFAAFAVISLVPVYKLFVGMPDLQGSRFSYLASAPLSAFFAFGIAALPSLFRLNYWSATVGQVFISTAYFSTAALMLWVNNQPWVVANHWVAKLEKSFNATMAHAEPNDRFLYFNIPNNYRGAYLARNAIGDIGEHANVAWSALEPDDKHCETGQVRQDLTEGTKHYASYYWDDSSGAFLPVFTEPFNTVKNLQMWNSLPIQERCKVIQGGARLKQSQNSFKVVPGATPLMLLLNLKGLSAWNMEFLQMSVSRAVQPAHDNAAQLHGGDQVSLLISNKLTPVTVLQPTILPPSASARGKQNLLFTTRVIPSWFCSDEKASAVLVLPPDWSGTFDLNIPGESSLLPTLKRVSTRHDVSARSSEVIKIDVSNVTGASGALMQISKKNQYFQKPNSGDFEPDVTGRLILVKATSSLYSLKYDDLLGEGQYQIRCWAVDSDGKPVGVSSDYLFVIAQKNAP